jgi:hypothetical protein
VAKNLYCPKCRTEGDSQAEFCTTCGTKLIPTMRIVIMPFVESGQEPASLGKYKNLVERYGELPPSLAIGCQMYVTSEADNPRLVASQKEAYFTQAEKILAKMVKDSLDTVGFYETPNPLDVDLIAQKASNMPTELFLMIQKNYDPEYLFLPEINYFFFRYPRPLTSGTGDDRGFGFVQISAFLLDNRENRIVGRGDGAGIELFDHKDATLDENYSVSAEEQVKVMRLAGAKAVIELLKNMKMVQ